MAAVTAPPPVYAQRMLDAARICFVVSAAALPLSTAATNLFAVLGFLSWALSGQWQPALRSITAEPVAWLGCALFALLALGIGWSLVPPAEAAAALLKYRELLFFGVVLFLFANARWRARLLGAFFAGALVLLALSYAVYLGLFTYVDERGFSSAENAVLLKNAITHGFIMSLLAYGTAVLAMQRLGWQRWALALVSLLAAANVWLAVQGRTGYVVLAILVLWFAYSRWSWKGLAASVAGLALLLVAAYQWAPVFQTRVTQAAQEARDYRFQGHPGETSIGSRLHFWKRSAEWLSAHPIAGAGTGGWVEAFYAATEGDDAYMHNRDRSHPHNEYVHLAVQLGPFGAGLFAAMLFVAFRNARRLQGEYAAWAQGLVLAFAVGSLFNDLLFDSTEGHLWALVGGALFAAAQALPSAGYSGAGSKAD
ncbi:MAG: O-antigen ligase family protein [Betaproteobacteria bacterium]|nr:O-antigen ligase family protein [Betaproteobacteria bacterium]